uniref:Uncharacterized protein n=1 Tax=Chromera velia CCMP2878 TaxID=1169474 RepID=A0A0G4GAG8_9ALVE|eukprot:Cvel_21001.t1-p1 / transcript=Cvel_21001.t1 / gene=Cvel_21001 / organism=Chromera_velia_CCMP2878 / gene_product=hypothetical protein / transcript_product=hypothetical protein / location=Cvel_scaffold1934:27219-31771(+) / protein_length=352 / sequence_SO=supercontig / SO=protein_coding / is_pseudo=false
MLMVRRLLDVRELIGRSPQDAQRLMKQYTSTEVKKAVNRKLPNGDTSLLMALRRDLSPVTVKMLLPVEAGADVVKAVDRNGDAALLMELRKDSPSCTIMKMLLEAGADAKAVDRLGREHLTADRTPERLTVSRNHESAAGSRGRRGERKRGLYKISERDDMRKEIQGRLEAALDSGALVVEGLRTLVNSRLNTIDSNSVSDRIFVMALSERLETAVGQVEADLSVSRPPQHLSGLRLNDLCRQVLRLSRSWVESRMHLHVRSGKCVHLCGQKAYEYAGTAFVEIRKGGSSALQFPEACAEAVQAEKAEAEVMKRMRGLEDECKVAKTGKEMVGLVVKKVSGSVLSSSFDCRA